MCIVGRCLILAKQKITIPTFICLSLPGGGVGGVMVLMTQPSKAWALQVDACIFRTVRKRDGAGTGNEFKDDNLPLKQHGGWGREE